jgi:DNA-binding LacI/PurR family transcriptional regulator
VAQPTRELGRQAMQLLLSRIETGSDDQRATNYQRIILQPELRLRESTAPHYKS